jgi:hypothetical protein
MSFCSQFTNISNYFAEVNIDITKVNQHANLLLNWISAKGKTTHNLLSNLLRANKMVKDNEFLLHYIMEIFYEEHIVDCMLNKFILQAENKFKTQKVK